jgi:hypothetical protein
MTEIIIWIAGDAENAVAGNITNSRHQWVISGIKSQKIDLL